MRKQNPIDIIGETTDDKIVVKGLFKMYDTLGLPLEVMFDELQAKGIVPSWIDFYNEAKEAGWKHKTIISRLSESIFDVWGKDFRDMVISKLVEYN